MVPLAALEDRYVHRRVGQTLADDLTAETFARAFDQRSRYDPTRQNACPWLFGIAGNLLRSHYHTEERQLRAYARTGVDPITPCDVDGIIDRVDATAEGALIAAALAALHRADRDVLLLFAWADLSYTEIADALDVPVGTVRSRLHRARFRVRESLSIFHNDLTHHMYPESPHGEACNG
ncbi:MAG: RNA polymerase sigma factor [Chloroflexota bacterium]